LPRLALNCDPLISASWVARITGESHQHAACFSFFLICLASGPVMERGKNMWLWKGQEIREK
jgi:hypothetical protein